MEVYDKSHKRSGEDATYFPDMHTHDMTHNLHAATLGKKNSELSSHRNPYLRRALALRMAPQQHENPQATLLVPALQNLNRRFDRMFICQRSTKACRL